MDYQQIWTKARESAVAFATRMYGKDDPRYSNCVEEHTHQAYVNMTRGPTPPTTTERAEELLVEIRDLLKRE